MTDSQIKPNTKILITGASGGIGCAVIQLLSNFNVKIGAHYYTNASSIQSQFETLNRKSEIKSFQADLTDADASHKLVDEFVIWAGGIDVLIQLTGGVAKPISWDKVTEQQWVSDLNLNLTSPFFLSQRAISYMRSQNSGKIILSSTASAKHGGGSNSIAYGVAKAGIECLTKGLARIGAPNNILVNAICPGLIDTAFHTKYMGRDDDELRKRTELIPLKRSGTPFEVANLIIFLASPQSTYITGECISISGGDWL